MSPASALIVDDEPDIRELLEITLQRMHIQTHSAADLTGAYQLLKTNNFDLCLADMRLPDGDGIALVRHINQHHPQMPVAMITAHGNMDSAIEALKAGAFDFVSKPVELTVLRGLVTTALRLHQQPESTVSTLLGNTPAMQHIRQMIGKLARSQAPVFIHGESGTGKELAARSIHQQSPRADKPFIAINCGAIPSELIESEFFGHTKGSFTGAIQNKQGLFSAAHGGTLFLDEIAELPLSMQVKLLRTIQEKTVRPVGATEETPINVRMISATHKNIAQMVAENTFRQDLFYRIHVIELTMPSLRDHIQDIPLLAKHILGRIEHSQAMHNIKLSTQAEKKLQAYDYPGNVRELENILERAYALCDSQTIQIEDLGLPDTIPHVTPAANLPEGDITLEDYLANVEKKLLVSTLKSTRWNRTAAAKKLGLSFRSIRYRLEKLGLNKETKE